MYKKCDARAKLLFCSLNQLFFLTFSLSSASLDLKVPNDSNTLRVDVERKISLFKISGYVWTGSL